MGSATDTRVRIGARLRSARHSRGLSLEQVAAATGLTKGFISQVERDRTSISVASLLALCDALGIRIGSLFEATPARLVRRAERNPINFGGEGVTEFLLTPTSEARLQVIESHIDPGGGGGEQLYTLQAEAEFVHVIAGELELRVGAERHHLEAGDSLTFSGREAHTWANPSPDAPAHVLWALSPSPW